MHAIKNFLAKCMPLNLIPVAVFASFLGQILLSGLIITASNPLINVLFELIGNRNADDDHASSLGRCRRPVTESMLHLQPGGVDSKRVIDLHSVSKRLLIPPVARRRHECEGPLQKPRDSASPRAPGKNWDPFSVPAARSRAKGSPCRKSRVRVCHARPRQSVRLCLPFRLVASFGKRGTLVSP